MRVYWVICLCLSFVMTSAWAQNDDIIIFAGNANRDLAEKISDHLGKPLGKAIVDRFNDGESHIRFLENVRNKHVFVIQSTSKTADASVNDNLMELYLMIRTLKRASVKEITAIIPYYGYARQDRKTESRVPISASDVAMLLEKSGLDRIIAIDLHCGQIQGFFHHVPVDNIYASIITMPYFKSLNLKNPVIVSPDAGGVERAKKFKEVLSREGVSSDFAVIIKEREKAGSVSKATLIGDVKGKDAIIIDDLCDTGGTLAKAGEELKKFGARNVYASISHPIFSKNAIEKLDKSEFSQIVVTDSIPLRDTSSKKIKQLSVAPLLAEVIKKINAGESISAVFS